TRIVSEDPGAIENAQVFFDSLTFSLKELEQNYPPENDPGETPQETLERLTKAGAERRYPEGIPPKVAQQIDYELKLI
ncbi:hypothetical protein ACC772_40120, partial [Rhizobium ruizarguesonis]